MDMKLLEQEIAKIEASIDQYNEADTLVIYDSISAIRDAGYKLEAVEPLLQLIERHPTTYFGDPGEIVHYIEQPDTEYEKYLLASLKRAPAVSTVWMLNRCINGCVNAGEHAEELLEIMKDIANRADIDKEISDRARLFADYQENR